MDATILSFLLLDGLQNGVVYGLLALSLVLVFAVTRVILVPIGELLMFAPLSLVWLLEGKLPGTLWLALALEGPGPSWPGAGEPFCPLWAGWGFSSSSF